jgi:uncharacterized membrane protein YheB (UPF0754 family)
MWWQLVVKALAGAGIGWFTNWLAIRMLFRPRRARRVLGLTIQGVVPRRRADLARKVAETFERELFSHEDLKAAVNAPNYREALGVRIQEHLHEYLAEKVANAPRLLRLVISRRTLERFASGLAQDVMRYVPSLIDGAAADLKTHFDIRQLIRSKIEAFELERLEAIVEQIAGRELRFIEVLGGVIGLVVGAALALVEEWIKK